MHILIPALHRPCKPTGVCRHAVNLAQCLAISEQVEQITLLVGEWQRDYFKKLFNFESSKVRIEHIHIENTSFTRNQWFMFGLPKLAQRLQPDIIHMTFPFPFVRRWFEVPVVASIHDLYPYECPTNFGYPQVWFNQIFLWQCIHNSDGLLCVSKCTLDSLEEYFPFVGKDKKTAVIYNVVDFSEIEPQRPQLLGQGFTASFLLTVAQHRKNKNLDLLIKAYGALLQNNQIDLATQLLIVGSSGPETNNLTRLVQTSNLEDKVLFLSGLDNGELRWLYEQASLFIIPSSTEGFCLPLVEALSLSCPVVCSDIPIFREVGSSRCCYFTLGQEAGTNLAKTISLELSHSKSSEKILDFRFSKNEISQQLLNFYKLLYSSHN